MCFNPERAPLAISPPRHYPPRGGNTHWLQSRTGSTGHFATASDTDAVNGGFNPERAPLAISPGLIRVIASSGAGFNPERAPLAVWPDRDVPIYEQMLEKFQSRTGSTGHFATFEYAPGKKGVPSFQTRTGSTGRLAAFAREP